MACSTVLTMPACEHGAKTTRPFPMVSNVSLRQCFRKTRGTKWRVKRECTLDDACDKAFLLYPVWSFRKATVLLYYLHGILWPALVVHVSGNLA